LETELFEWDGGIPFTAVADHGVEDGEQFPHARDHGNFGWLSLGPEAQVEHPYDGVPLGGTQDAHVESGPDGSASAPDPSLASKEATITSKWCNADERGDLLVGESSELRELSDERACEVGTDAWNVAQEIVFGLPDRALSDEPIEVGVDAMELALEPSDVLLDALLDRG
jgi:hypothetical protein